MKVDVYIVHGIMHKPLFDKFGIFENLNFGEFFKLFLANVHKLVNFQTIFIKLDSKCASLHSPQHIY